MNEILLECPECGEKGAYIAENNPHLLICSLCACEFEIEYPETPSQQ